MGMSEILIVSEVVCLLNTAQNDPERKTPCREGRQGVAGGRWGAPFVFMRDFMKALNLCLLPSFSTAAMARMRTRLKSDSNPQPFCIQQSTLQQHIFEATFVFLSAIDFPNGIIVLIEQIEHAVIVCYPK